MTVRKTGKKRVSARRRKTAATAAVGGVKVAPKSAKALRRAIGLTRPLMARLVNVSERSLASYENDEAAPTEAVKRRLHEVNRLRAALQRVMAPDDLAAWLQTPNDAFAGLKPLEVIERGESDRLWRMLYLIESGEAF